MMPAFAPDDFWTPGAIQAITRGRWLGEPSDTGMKLFGLGIDSRTLKPGQVFLAVRGDRFDGHEFVQSAQHAGAGLVIIDQVPTGEKQSDHGVLQVEDTLIALRQLAAAYREILRRMGCTVIAVVGSNGKTTTRHLIYAVLSEKFTGSQSPKSFNNHLGVPLTLLGADPKDGFLVAEVGTNHPGEIASLGELLQPDSVVVTSIGREHIEFFGDLHGVVREEASIFRHMALDGKAFIESDAYRWIKDTPGAVQAIGPIVFGLGSEDSGSKRQNLGGRQRFTLLGGTPVDLPLIAPHDVCNALGAAEVGRAMGVDEKQIKHALEAVSPRPGRVEVKQFGPITVIDDTYNANPDSTLAALHILAEYPIHPDGRRLVVLGDMLELGDQAVPSHRELGESLAGLLGDRLIHHAVLIGRLMTYAAEGLGDVVQHFPEIKGDTAVAISGQLRPNDVILFKGSRGLQLERLLPAVEERASTMPPP